MKKWTIFTMSLLIAACSPFRIVDYKTYDENQLQGTEPAILFYRKVYNIVKFDGKEVDFVPVMAGAYGGIHVYMKPGEHEIEFGWDGSERNEKTATLTFTAESHTYYKLTADYQGNFIIKKAKIPDDMPDSTWNFRWDKKQ